ncbi:type II toxin-antitoxin system VapC family toxin [Methylomagnum sp.]
MILIDTGPLVALINKNDPNHGVCVQATKFLPRERPLTTWPCFTEAMYLLFRSCGHPAQAELWRWWAAGRLALHHPIEDEVRRMAVLMEKYRDTPMDLADASLVAIAETLGIHRIFTLDSDFRVYRLANGTALECIP